MNHDESGSDLPLLPIRGLPKGEKPQDRKQHAVPLVQRYRNGVPVGEPFPMPPLQQAAWKALWDYLIAETLKKAALRAAQTEQEPDPSEQD
jgi:hypothetical protein